MKIACIIHSLDGGGAERVIASLASRLAARNHNVTLITLDDGTHDRHAVADGVVRKRLNLMSESRHLWGKLFRTRQRIRTIRSTLVEESPDVILSFCDRTNILVLLAARPASIPVVISERSDPSQQQLGRLWEWLRDRTYPSAAAIVALTETSAVHLRHRFDRPLTVISSAVDLPPVQSDRQLAVDNQRILGIGRLEQEKGFDRLIDAFAIVAGHSPHWSLRILGDGSLRSQLERQVSDLHLSDRVSFAGWVRPVWSELAEATIFALPSRYEGFPSSLLEAMAAGVPSVAVDCESGPRAVIDNVSSGLLVDNDVQSLAGGIERLIQDPDYRESIGSAGKNVLDRFGWDAMVDAYEEVLRENQRRISLRRNHVS